MPWRQQASRPIQCRSCTGRMPLRGVLRRSRLPERNRHAGDFWRPKACQCLMTVWRQGEPGGFVAQTSCQSCVSHSSCSGPFVGCQCERACTASRATMGALVTRQRMSLSASRHTFGQRINTPMQKSSLAPRRRTRHLPINIHGRPLAEGRLGRKGGWGGREAH